MNFTAGEGWQRGALRSKLGGGCQSAVLASCRAGRGLGGGAAASAGAGVQARWEALYKIDNKYSRDSCAERRDLPVSRKAQHSQHAFDKQRLPAPKHRLPVGVLTQVATSLTNLKIKNTACHKTSIPTSVLHSYSEPGRLFLARELTFFPSNPNPRD